MSYDPRTSYGVQEARPAHRTNRPLTAKNWTHKQKLETMLDSIKNGDAWFPARDLGPHLGSHLGSHLGCYTKTYFLPIETCSPPHLTAASAWQLVAST
jgi:hypothetical protein